MDLDNEQKQHAETTKNIRKQVRTRDPTDAETHLSPLKLTRME